MPADPALAPADVAARLGVSGRLVLHWIGTGQLAALNVSRNPRSKRPTWRIPAAALEAFEAGRTATAPAPRVARRKRAGDVIEFYR
jgi:hypothetical protein